MLGMLLSSSIAEARWGHQAGFKSHLTSKEHHRRRDLRGIGTKSAAAHSSSPASKPAAEAFPSYTPPASESEKEESKEPKEKEQVDLDEEDTPEWYKTNAKSNSCYKLTEQALFNFEQMRKEDGDWQVTDVHGH